MHLQLLIPGLLQLPADSLRLPALSLLLGRGRLAWGPGTSSEEWLAKSFGLDSDRAPYAALRLLGEDGLEPGKHDWLCADPAQLKFTSRGLMLADASTLNLSAEEAGGLTGSLNREFSDLGEFFAPNPGRWYLRLNHPARLTTQRLSQVIGRRVDQFLPEGQDGALWRRHFNEIQVFLHGHPVNQAREDAHRPPINSLWFWGQGSLPETLGKPFAALATHTTNSPLARGLARHAGIPIMPWPEGPLPEGAGRVLLTSDSLNAPALYGDEDAWRSALSALETRHLVPAVAALKSGRLQSLPLTAPGDAASLEVRLTRSDLWKFWRPAVSLSSMKPPHGHSEVAP